MPVFETDIRPLFTTYCVDCHNNDRAKGDLNIEQYEAETMVLDNLAVWQRIAKRISEGEMPPKDPRPTEDEKAAMLAWIQGLKDDFDCDRVASEASVSWYPGFVMSRRLNRAEYENTVRDLFEVEVDVAEMFPADGAGGEGFDNTGSALYLSSIQMEQYLQAADLVVESAFPSMTGLAAQAGEPGAGDRLRSRLDRIVTARPAEGLQPREAASVVLAEFLPRTWRRPYSADEIGRMLSLFDDATAQGETYIGALKLCFKAALVSPNFIFLAEPEPPHPGEYALADFPLASRMSYFLWGTMPDEELFGLARAGKLQDLETLERQVERMLRDPKARGLGDLFATQWLGITQLGGNLRPDPNRFPEFDDALAALMREEVVTFFYRLLADDRSLIDIIDGGYTYANERLATLYGLTGVTGEELQQVQFADNRRGGVLGMAAVLTTTSHPLRTSPVLRGKWVLNQLLGDHVPPPPPDVPPLPEEGEAQAEGLTLRERLEAHRSQPDCAGCHSRMDPIGFGLENFDPIGRWRETDAGQPVDANGTLPSGENFNGPGELKAILLARKDDIMRNLSRKLLGYALGRSLTQYDNCVVDECMLHLQAEEYRPSALFKQIVLSYPFRHRYSGQTSE
jgi:hypothetical protein